MDSKFTESILLSDYVVLDILKNNEKEFLGVIANEHGDSENNVVIKSFNFNSLSNTLGHLKELQLLKGLNDTNFLKVSGCLRPTGSYDRLYAVMEYMPTDLQKICYSNNELAMEQIRYISYQILRGVRYLHEQGVIHTDLKLEHITINSDLDIKIHGLRMAVLADRNTVKYKSGITSNHTFTDERGSYKNLRHSAPEIIASNFVDYFTSAVDIWSIGCIIAELLGKQSLFPCNDISDYNTSLSNILGPPIIENNISVFHTVDVLKDDQMIYPTFSLTTINSNIWRLHFPKYIENNDFESVTELLTKMLQYNPSLRINVTDAIRHSFFNEIREDVDFVEYSSESVIDPNIFLIEETPSIDTVKLKCWQFIREFHSDLPHYPPTDSSPDTDLSVKDMTSIKNLYQDTVSSPSPIATSITSNVPLKRDHWSITDSAASMNTSFTVLLYDRYRVELDSNGNCYTENNLVYISTTCIILKAKDILDEVALYVQPRPVALKFIGRIETFQNELDARCGEKELLDKDFVLEIIRTHEPVMKSSHSLGGVNIETYLTKSYLENNFYCLVLPLANITLYLALKCEHLYIYSKHKQQQQQHHHMQLPEDRSSTSHHSNTPLKSSVSTSTTHPPTTTTKDYNNGISLNISSNTRDVRHIFKEIVQAVGHLHTNGRIHGDIKPTNIIREGNRWKLLDLESSVYIGHQFVCQRKYSSAYMPPEVIYIPHITHQQSTNIRNILHHHYPNNNHSPTHLTSRLSTSNSPLQSMTSAVNKSVSAISAVIKSPNNWTKVSPWQCITAHPSYDIWSLGCVLYAMCCQHTSNLFESDINDQISSDSQDSDSLYSLGLWSDELKEKKLSKIKDVLARNLISQLLTREPNHRPSIDRILGHPFITGKSVQRLAELEVRYDVYLSYRMAADTTLAEEIYRHLTHRGCTVWLDSKCQVDDSVLDKKLMHGLLRSRVFIPIMSRNAINNPSNEYNNLSKLTESTPYVDNLLLEYRLALELKRRGLIEVIYPILVGDVMESESSMESISSLSLMSKSSQVKSTDAAIQLHFSPKIQQYYSHYYQSNCYPIVPNIIVNIIEQQCKYFLDHKFRLGLPLFEDMTIKDILSEITSNQSGFIVGHGSIAIDHVCEAIYEIMNTIKLTIAEISELNLNEESMNLSADAADVDADNALKNKDIVSSVNSERLLAFEEYQTSVLTNLEEMRTVLMIQKNDADGLSMAIETQMRAFLKMITKLQEATEMVATDTL